jgi:hypothetical protein
MIDELLLEALAPRDRELEPELETVHVEMDCDVDDVGTCEFEKLSAPYDRIEATFDGNAYLRATIADVAYAGGLAPTSRRRR